MVKDQDKENKHVRKMIALVVCGILGVLTLCGIFWGEQGFMVGIIFFGVCLFYAGYIALSND